MKRFVVEDDNCKHTAESMSDDVGFCTKCGIIWDIYHPPLDLSDINDLLEQLRKQAEE